MNKLPINQYLIGDNLELLKQIDSNSIDLIYSDPPYWCNKDFYNEIEGKSVGFKDTWSSLDEYNNFIEIRLIEMHRILKDTGSIYVHVDPRISHHIRILLDKVFGLKQWRNEIVWCYYGPSTSKQKHFPKKHDTILWYSKSNQWIFNTDAVRIPYPKGSIDRMRSENGAGFVVNGERMTRETAEMIIARGKLLESHWTDIGIVARSKVENTKYPTQKPIRLLERIINASTNEDDLVLDCFAGSGTTGIAAKKLDRKYILIDQNQDAKDIFEQRLQELPRTLAEFFED